MLSGYYVALEDFSDLVDAGCKLLQELRTNLKNIQRFFNKSRKCTPKIFPEEWFESQNIFVKF